VRSLAILGGLPLDFGSCVRRLRARGPRARALEKVANSVPKSGGASNLSGAGLLSGSFLLFVLAAYRDAGRAHGKSLLFGLLFL